MNRRGPGEGSVYERGDGRWCAYVTVESGARRYFYGRTRAEVRRKLTEGVKRRDEGLPMPPERETVATFLASWLEAQRSRLKPRTWMRYEAFVRLHTVPVIGNVPLGRLSPQHIERLYAGRLKAGLGPVSVHHLHAVLHKAFEQAVRWDLVARNPIRLVDPPRMPRREMTVLSQAQARQLLDAAAGGPIEALLATAIGTGMRRGELLGLRWRDVDFDRGVARVVGTLQRNVEGELLISETKTAKSRRQVELPAFVVEALRGQLAAQAERRRLLGRDWNPLDLVFPSTLGEPQDGSHLLSGQFHPLMKKAGLPRIRFHDLRHTAATLMLSRGVHPKIASEMLGHSTTAITMDLYSHVTPTMQREAAKIMDDLLGR